jgi:hypothetical protein
MATALVLAANLASAVTYYGMFPREPIKAVDQFVNVPRALTTQDRVATVMEAIAKNEKAGGGVVIVCHGTDNALAIRMGTGPAGLGVDILRNLMAAMDGKYSDADMAKRLGFDPRTGLAEWQRLKASITKVWSLNLARVDLRACEVGRNPTLMYYLQRLFNCGVCCAPKAFDVFGSIALVSGKLGPTQDERSWRQWLAANPGASRLGSGATLFAWKPNILSNAVQVNAMAASWEAAQNWVARHLPPGGYKSGSIPYHALTPAKDRLIFAGDSDYRSWLVETAKGTPEPKPDFKAPLDPRQLP